MQPTLRRMQRQLQETNQRFANELALAGSRQASFLPGEPPLVPGWQIAMTLALVIVARESAADP